VLENQERRLVSIAEEIVRSLPHDDTHTVAAAAMDNRGNVHTGVNVFHFTGGPCAEVVTIAAAAQALAGLLVTIVAVGDRDRGVISPCGRCRQILLDLHPDVAVIVPLKDGELAARTVRDLLPLSHSLPEAAEAD
jgi:cytidine deaminase